MFKRCEQTCPMTDPWDWYRIFTDPWMVDFYGFHVGKYTVRPMDGMGV